MKALKVKMLELTWPCGCVIYFFLCRFAEVMKLICEQENESNKLQAS